MAHIPDTRDTARLTDYLTVDASAVMVERSAATIWRYIREGRLKTHRVLGRTLLLRRDVEALRDELSR
jgi:hypothetical protein